MIQAIQVLRFHLLELEKVRRKRKENQKEENSISFRFMNYAIILLIVISHV